MRIMLLLLILPGALGAEIVGNIYNYDLEPVEDVVLTISTEPMQQYISKDGTYRFNLSEGEYTLSARYRERGELKYYYEGNITVAASGVYLFDIIMFPSLQTEEELSEELQIDLEVEDEPAPAWWYYVPLALLLAALLYFLARKKKKCEPDETRQSVLEIIRKEKRISQKEIRKRLPCSEAKVSLVVAELEQEGQIKKFKKGRGNVIVYKG